MAATVTWHSGLVPCTSRRREVVGRATSCAAAWCDLAELHCVVVDAATCAAAVFDDRVGLDGVQSAYVGISSTQNDPGVCDVLLETQGSRERIVLLQSRRCASFIDEDMGVYELDSLAATVSRCTSALEFSD